MCSYLSVVVSFKYSTMVTYYHIENKEGTRIYENIPDLSQAQEVIMQLGIDGYRIIEETRSTVKPGFGRDPDLH